MGEEYSLPRWTGTLDIMLIVDSHCWARCLDDNSKYVNFVKSILAMEQQPRGAEYRESTVVLMFLKMHLIQ